MGVGISSVVAVSSTAKEIRPRCHNAKEKEWKIDQKSTPARMDEKDRDQV